MTDLYALSVLAKHAARTKGTFSFVSTALGRWAIWRTLNQPLWLVAKDTRGMGTDW